MCNPRDIQLFSVCFLSRFVNSFIHVFMFYCWLHPSRSHDTINPLSTLILLTQKIKRLHAFNPVIVFLFAIYSMGGDFINITNTIMFLLQ